MDLNTLVATIAALAAAALSAVAAALALRAWKGQREQEDAVSYIASSVERIGSAVDALSASVSQTGVVSLEAARRAEQEAARAQQRFDAVARDLDQLERKMDDVRRETADQLSANREQVDGRLSEVRVAVERQLGSIREDNARQLDRMRETVDEKLSHTLNDRLATSFKQVSDQLEAVYAGLGDMRSIATGVGDLKRVLSNVKTRGILGEVQLGAILADILALDQYAENVATKPGSAERVEFAVKLPVEGGDPIWLPIDSKFPGDAYEHLRDAVEAADAEGIATARRQLEQRIRSEAKDICTKYLSVPDTTNFGILFLPFEGLYAEVVDRPGLIECLQRDYQVVVAGPSTMAVILNSLQMSYQTFAFQRRADEIQKVLAAVKAELPHYQSDLRRALKQIQTAEKTVDTLINRRTNVLERKLRDVTALEDAGESARALGYAEDSEAEENEE